MFYTFVLEFLRIILQWVNFVIYVYCFLICGEVQCVWTQEMHGMCVCVCMRAINFKDVIILSFPKNEPL